MYNKTNNINTFFSDSTVSRPFVWHVRADGSDAADGKTYATAKGTIQGALTAIGTEENQTILLWEGYHEVASTLFSSLHGLTISGLGREISTVYTTGQTGIVLLGRRFSLTNMGILRDTMVSESPALLSINGEEAYLENLYLENSNAAGLTQSPTISCAIICKNSIIKNIKAKSYGPIFSLGEVKNTTISDIDNINLSQGANIGEGEILSCGAVTGLVVRNVYHVSTYPSSNNQSLIKIGGDITGNCVIDNFAGTPSTAYDSSIYTALQLGGSTGSIVINNFNMARPLLLDSAESYDISYAEGSEIKTYISYSDIDLDRLVRANLANILVPPLTTYSGYVQTSSVSNVAMLDQMRSIYSNGNIVVAPRKF